MREKQRKKAEVKKQKEIKKRIRRHQLKKQADRQEDSSLKEAMVMAFGLLMLLGIGWYLLYSHIHERRTKYGWEPAMKKPYFDWFNTASNLYIAIAAIVILLNIILLMNEKKISWRFPKITSLIKGLPFIAAGTGAVGGLLAALIKVEVPHLAFSYGLILAAIIFTQLILYQWKKGWFPNTEVICLSIAALVSLVFLFMGESTVERFYIIGKGRNPDPIGTKIFTCLIGLGGYLLIAIPLYFILFYHRDDSAEGRKINVKGGTDLKG
ncbi:hypothetical protein CEF21_20050 [Bacillus sp. FJAT-42376]|uniref:hypothetical protein n=1 Tax=Bacillus sp. FJAT-42376 TaxID=2014076 RepID=UPI000F50BB83|nr:hypothetical protein [Bacillus sp. FJAT-42376]AZB44400.1 hypothetical protein CEF21_20050 [Bacillus sp. FJAT-42376]